MLCRINPRCGAGGEGRGSGRGLPPDSDARAAFSRILVLSGGGGAGGARGFVFECDGLGRMNCNHLSLGTDICYFFFLRFLLIVDQQNEGLS